MVETVVSMVVVGRPSAAVLVMVTTTLDTNETPEVGDISRDLEGKLIVVIGVVVVIVVEPLGDVRVVGTCEDTGPLRVGSTTVGGWLALVVETLTSTDVAPPENVLVDVTSVETFEEETVDDPLYTEDVGEFVRGGVTPPGILLPIVVAIVDAVARG